MVQCVEWDATGYPTMRVCCATTGAPNPRRDVEDPPCVGLKLVAGRHGSITGIDNSRIAVASDDDGTQYVHITYTSQTHAEEGVVDHTMRMVVTDGDVTELQATLEACPCAPDIMAFGGLFMSANRITISRSALDNRLGLQFFFMNGATKYTGETGIFPDND